MSALRVLTDSYDVLVVGDGELAVFEALADDPPKLVDGDNPKSVLFLTKRRLTDLPFPARVVAARSGDACFHPVDVRPDWS